MENTTDTPTPGEAPQSSATATLRRSQPPAGAPELIGDLPDDVLPGPEEPEFHKPVTLLAIDPLGGQNQTFPSFDRMFLPILSDFVTLLAKASPSVAGMNVQNIPRKIGLPSASLTTRRGPKGKKVTVIRVDLDIYAGSIRHLDQFDTASAASQALGCKYNAVHQALHRSGGQPAEIDGVTFEYSEDYMARINADVGGD